MAAIAQEPMRLDVDPTTARIERDGRLKAEFFIEIATTSDQRSNGLMHRRDLPKDRGMLFVFEGEAIRYFWMENTPTPLDIIYADADGVIVHIARDTVPFSRMPIPSIAPAQYALEVHAGLSAQAGIEPGDRIAHPKIAAD